MKGYLFGHRIIPEKMCLPQCINQVVRKMKSVTDIFVFILTKNCIILPPEKDRQFRYSQKGNHQSGLHQSQKE